MCSNSDAALITEVALITEAAIISKASIISKAGTERFFNKTGFQAVYYICRRNASIGTDWNLIFLDNSLHLKDALFPKAVTRILRHLYLRLHRGHSRIQRRTEVVTWIQGRTEVVTWIQGHTEVVTWIQGHTCCRGRPGARSSPAQPPRAKYLILI